VVNRGQFAATFDVYDARAFSSAGACFVFYYSVPPIPFLLSFAIFGASSQGVDPQLCGWISSSGSSQLSCLRYADLWTLVSNSTCTLTSEHEDDEGVREIFFCIGKIATIHFDTCSSLTDTHISLL